MYKYQKSIIRIKESQLRPCFPIGHISLNSNFAILKIQKLFSIRVKELFEPIVLRKIGDGVFAL